MLCLIFRVVNCKADFRYSWHFQEQKSTLSKFEGVKFKTCKLIFWEIGPDTGS